jgi:minor extracellular serine protease Vpr
MSRQSVARAFGAATVSAALVAGGASLVPSAADEHEDARLHLVTLQGPGTAGADTPAEELLEEQDSTLAEVGSPEPVYRFTTALNGYAVPLTEEQAGTLAETAGVAMVEPNGVRRLAGLGAATSASLLAARPPGARGRGVVVGVVDSGLDPDSPVFADSRSRGRLDPGFAGECAEGDGWPGGTCTGKIVAAQHFVSGFGEDHRASTSRLSARDDHGHGTQVASLAAGNTVPARERGEDLGRFSGAAPDARVAVYKACWTAPDPEDDGCATADLVAAIDRAVADGVDVLALAATGSPRPDTVDRALLGAAEADVFVAAPAGNGGPTGHTSSWTTTVGGATGPQPLGRLVLSDGATFEGLMTGSRSIEEPRRVVDARTAPAPGWTADQAARCEPRSLDARRVSDAVVVCERGGVPRVDKSRAVALADGAGMVLVSGPDEAPTADLHQVPTVHVTAEVGALLRDRLGDGERPAARLEPDGLSGEPATVADWSPRGSARQGVAKPDLIALGTGLLSATTPASDGRRWELLSGSSASTALVAGAAAAVRSAHPDWTAAQVRSALMASAADAAGETSPRRQGAGLMRLGRALAPGLALDVARGDHRRVADGEADVADLNLPSLVTPRADRQVVLSRTVTNVSGDASRWSASAAAPRGYDVAVAPASMALAPGESREFRVTVTRRDGVPARTGDGWVAWHGADGTRVRLPLLVR